MNTIKSIILGFKSEKRILRYLLAITIVLFFVANVMSNEARAESGSITVTQDTTNSYLLSTSQTLDGSPDWTKIYWDSTSFNKINDFKVDSQSAGNNELVLANTFESSQFTITSGGTGGGVFYYDDTVGAYGRIYYVFNTGNSYTSSPLTLNFTSATILGNITVSTFRCNNEALSTTKPISVGNNGGGTCGALNRPHDNFNYITSTSSTATDSYTVTYPFSNGFTISVTKDAGVTTKWDIQNYLYNTYSKETTFNNINFQYTNSSYLGIIVNVSISSGSYVVRIINISNISTPQTPATTGNVTTDKSSYNTSENILYNYTLSNAPAGITDNRVKIFRYDNSFNQIPIFIDYGIANGVGNKSYFIPNDTISWHYYISLESYNTTTGWQEIDFKLINITKIQPSISLDNILYYFGEYIYIFTTATENGYIVLKDTNGATKFYKSISAGYTGQDYYWIRSSDAVGNWSVSLYNSTDSLIAVDYATIEYDVITEQTPTPTITPTPTPTMQQFPGGEGRAWTNAEIITWLSIYIPLLAQFIFVMLFIVIVLSIGNMAPRRRRR